MLLWRAGEKEWHREAPGSPRHAELLQELMTELSALSVLKLDELTQIEIAEGALHLGNRALATRLFETLGSNGLQFSADWYAEHARELIGQGEYATAIQLFLIARDRSQAVSAKRSYFFAAFGVPLSQNQPAEALALAEKELKDLQSDLTSLVSMVELARAANRPKEAAKYVRLMLRCALQDELNRLADADEFSVQWRFVADSPNSDLNLKLPFDNRIYALAYETFLANNDLDDAYRVAESAVRQAPLNATWRRRLARVAESSGRPQDAIVHWRWLAEHGSGLRREQDEVAQALLRLAPGLFDDQALQLGLNFELSQNPDDLRLLSALVDVYERMGEPEAGIAILQGFIAKHPSEEPMQALADLAERAADSELAIKTLLQINTRFGATRDRSMKLAAMLMGAGRIDDAYAALESARSQVLSDDTEYWRLSGALAARLQDKTPAREAYARLVNLDLADVDDFNVLIDILSDVDPAQAGEVALRASRQFNSWPHVLQALDYFSQAGRQERSGQVFAHLNPQWKAKGDIDVHFLAMRAAYFRSLGRTAAALADYERWRALAPNDPDACEGVLWLLVEGRDAGALKSLLAKHEEQWSRSERLHDALAAAWQTLSVPRVALERYLTPRVGKHKGDLLWMMNYADLLEQDQQGDMAWQLRQTLWQERPRAAPDVVPDQALREARVWLALTQTPGDRALSGLRELLRLDRVAQTKPGSLSDELLLAWLLAQNETEAARGYLWARYADRVSQPEWATLAVAKEVGGRPAASQVLSRRTVPSSRYDMASSALTLGSPEVAVSDAYESQMLLRDDEPLQELLNDTLLNQAARASVELEYRKYGEWRETEAVAQVESRVAPGARLSLALGGIVRNVDQEVVDAPNERYADLVFSRSRNAYVTEIGLGAHDSFASWVPISLSQSVVATDDWDLKLHAGWRQPTSESLELRAFGWRNSAGFDGSYHFTNQDRLTIIGQAAQYSTQNGIRLGKGQQIEATLSHSFKVDSRELSAELFLSHNHFKARSDFSDSEDLDRVAERIPGDESSSEKVATFMPVGYELYGLRLSSEMGKERMYSRKIRPYGSADVTYNTYSGVGYAVTAGVASSVFGADRLAFGVTTEKGGHRSLPRSTLFGISYWLAY
ncbi:hypothetical protein GCM10027046_30750 [Uliginosibacterium flavum]